MSSNRSALTVEKINKAYHIYGQPADRLKQLLFSPLKRLGVKKDKQYFTEFHALRDISFEVMQGETIGIIGPNGAGKSTLLQIISGVLSPTAGSIEINGRVAALLELGSSFNPEFTGIENVYLYGAIFGLDKQEMDKRLDDICQFAEIGAFVHQPIKNYSSGMVLRLAFAVIAHVDADILIIDEALTVGDAFYVQKCMRFLRRFMQKGTVLFVSHDAAAISNLCSHVIWLDEGRIRMQGSPKYISGEYLASIAKKTQKQTAFENKLPATNMVLSNKRNRKDVKTKDMRMEYINRSNLRNDLEIFQFQGDSLSFGQRMATIINVVMTDENNQVLSWVVGGEQIKICIECKAHAPLEKPIVGFYIKDRLGQHLFGDNTFLTYENNTLSIESGQLFQAWFVFCMPPLPIGEYTIAPAVAVGTQDDHSTQHWLHDALIFKSHSSSVINSLIGIPMETIEIVSSKKQLDAID